MGSKFYITTPIYYVNAAPHIGHSYTTIAADSIARYKRSVLGKENVRFLTGTDEHGQKIQKAADEAGVSAQQFVDTVSQQFRELGRKLAISNDDFIRTTESRHIKTVQRALEIVYANGDIYEDTYAGWYCTPCETFWPESQLTDRVCPDCKRPVEKINEKNYFFRLSKYQAWLIEYIETHPNFIRPHNRRNEVLSFLKLNALSDLCISRPYERLSWGIPLPFSSGHVTYVWFDALVNYISAVGSFDDAGRYTSAWWNEESQIVHLIGKDILRHHAVYWPIMLQALGVRLPDTIFAHGWWMIGDSKMSKSKGNVVSPLAMIDRFGIDTYRYFLLRDVPFGLDGNFSEEAIIKRFNGDLANDIGNLVYRTLTMVEKYYEGNVPACPKASDAASGLIYAKADRLQTEISAYLNAGADFNFSAALDTIWELINMANKHVENTKPWNLAKENRTEELKGFIRLLVDVIRVVADALYPVMPHTAFFIKEQMGEDAIKKGDPLFPRIDTKKG